MNDPIIPAPAQSYVYNNDNNKLLKTIVGHDKKELEFTINHFQETDQIWLTDVIPRLIQQAYAHGFTEARHMVRKRLHEALGTKQ